MRHLLTLEDWMAEQIAEVIDGPQSVVFDQAENRMHMHKALMLILLREAGTIRA